MLERPAEEEGRFLTEDDWIIAKAQYEAWFENLVKELESKPWVPDLLDHILAASSRLSPGLVLLRFHHS